MSTEFGVVCPKLPAVGHVSGMVSVLMQSLLATRTVEVRVAFDDDATWAAYLGSTIMAIGTIIPPGRHEFADSEFLSLDPARRGDELALLVVIVLAATVATLSDGLVLDEYQMLGGGTIKGEEIIFAAMARSPQSISDILQRIRSR